MLKVKPDMRIVKLTVNKPIGRKPLIRSSSLSRININYSLSICVAMVNSPSVANTSGSLNSFHDYL